MFWWHIKNKTEYLYQNLAFETFTKLSGTFIARVFDPSSPPPSPTRLSANLPPSCLSGHPTLLQTCLVEAPVVSNPTARGRCLRPLPTHRFVFSLCILCIFAQNTPNQCHAQTRKALHSLPPYVFFVDNIALF